MCKVFEELELAKVCHSVAPEIILTVCVGGEVAMADRVTKLASKNDFLAQQTHLK